MATRRLTFALFVLAALAGGNSAYAVVAYQVPAGTAGNQAFGGSLGMDFNVNTPVSVNQLGVFDDGSNGLSLTITGRLYDRVTQTEVAPALVFTPGSPGTLVDGSRFKDLPAPQFFAAGFQGTTVAEGYGVGEQNGNSVAPVWTTNSGGGALSFVGSGRFGAAGSFPATPDGGPANRYAAGTFNFNPLIVQGTAGTWSINPSNFNETANDPGPFDIEIQVTGIAPGGETVIAIDKSVLNNSGVDWAGFFMQLGQDAGADFVPSDASDDLFFTTSPLSTETSGAFPVVETDGSSEPDQLSFFGSLVEGATADFQVFINVPDLIDGLSDGIATFTLRQAAFVPEPATGSLLGIVGLAYLAHCRRRRR